MMDTSYKPDYKNAYVSIKKSAIKFAESELQKQMEQLDIQQKEDVEQQVHPIKKKISLSDSQLTQNQQTEELNSTQQEPDSFLLFPLETQIDDGPYTYLTDE